MEENIEHIWQISWGWERGPLGSRVLSKTWALKLPELAGLLLPARPFAEKCYNGLFADENGFPR